MRDVFILLTVLSTVPMIYLRPHVGILAWCWISYMNPHRLSWGFAYSLPVAMVVGLATLTAWIISKEPKKLHINAVSGLLLAFVGWMTFANLFAHMPSDAFDKWEQTFKILLMTFVSMILINNRERVHALIWVIVASLAFFGVKGGLFTILAGGEFRVWGPPRSFIADNNALAMALIMILPLVRYLQLQTESSLVRLGLYGIMAATAFSIIGSQSRGALLASAAMVAFFIWKSRRRVVFGIALFAMVGVGAFFVPQNWIDRMKTIETYQEDASAMTRLEVWEFATKLALDRPIFGGGFRVHYDRNLYLHYIPDAITGAARNYHSVYFEVLGELSFMGLFLYLAVMFAAWRSGTWIIRRTRNRPDLAWANDLARMVQVSLVGFAVAGTFQNLAYFDLYFHLITLLFVTKVIVTEEIGSTATARSAGGGRLLTAPSSTVPSS